MSAGLPNLHRAEAGQGCSRCACHTYVEAEQGTYCAACGAPKPLEAAAVIERADLFQLGFFTLHSGEKSSYKIECDALTDNELDALAYMLHRRLPCFSSVVGVPRGGRRLAAAMQQYARPVGTPMLIVDDVYTTGSTMEELRAGRPAIGGVLFARRRVTQPWIKALWTMSEEL